MLCLYCSLPLLLWVSLGSCQPSEEEEEELVVQHKELPSEHLSSKGQGV